MTSVNFIHFQKHTSPIAVAGLPKQNWNASKVYCNFGDDERSMLGRNSVESDKLYITNLPAC